MSSKRASQAVAVSEEDRRCLPPIAQALFGSSIVRVFGAKDVLIWRQESPSGKPRIRIAFRAPALTINQVYARESQDRSSGPGFVPNRDHHMDVAIQHALGFDDVRVARQQGRAVGVDGGMGQSLEEGQTTYLEVLRVIGQGAAVKLSECLGLSEEERRQLQIPGQIHPRTEDIQVEANLMPMEGAPLVPHYSAKKKAWIPPGEPPPFLMETLYLGDDGVFRSSAGSGDKEHRVRVADLCKLYPHLASCSKDIVAVRTYDPSETRGQYTNVFDSAKKNENFMVVHATKPDPEHAKLVARCGGWLFPSLGVGLVPSVTFGPLVLVAGVGTVLDALKPYRTGRGVWPITVYDTDTWTLTSKGLWRAGRSLYEQMTGTYDEDSAGHWGALEGTGAHQWILGAPTSTGGFGSSEDDVKPMTSTAQLASALAARWKIWKYTEDVEDLYKTSPGGLRLPKRDVDPLIDQYASTKHRYPYLEAKVNGIMNGPCWQLAVCAKAWAKKARAYMRATGMTAPLILVPDPAGREVREGSEDGWVLDPSEAYAYSQVVAEAIVDFAKRENRIRTYST